MAELQLDMFEVKLGAAILLQFRTDSGIVRVLADGGVTGYPKNHVHKKLGGAIDAFEQGADRRIDLIIGTHYDADHLDGLVPIIEDKSIAIGETWLPPVANEVDPHAIDEPVGDANLLALQFAGENGDAVFNHYVRAKASLCERLADIERGADEIRGFQRKSELSFGAFHNEVPVEEGVARTFFEGHLEDARDSLGEADDDHAAGAVIETFTPDLFEDPYIDLRFSPLKRVVDRWHEVPELAEPGARTLAHLRKIAAKEGITATSLRAVVKALKARNLPIRCAIIDDATPRRFVWDKQDERFRPSAQGASDGPELLLLGPSKSLVKKHWDKLPVETYAKAALFSRLPIKGISESNELSYVAKLSFASQNILITGDTGFVDFRPERTRNFYPPMLAALADLHIIQVAHHGGANAYFYDALLAAPFAKQQERTYLLLSHGIDDIHRPSNEFALFMEQLDRPTPWVELLFTSRPQEKFVRDFKRAFAPVVPGPSADRGDVRLSFAKGAWAVDSHAVAPP